MWAVCVPGAHEGLKRVPASLELELQIVSHCVTAGTQAHPLQEQQVI